MAKKAKITSHTDNYKFKITDKIWWWGSNLLALITSLVLTLSLLISILFRIVKPTSRPILDYMRLSIIIILAGAIFSIGIGIYIYYSPCQTSDFGDKPRDLLIRHGDSVYDIAYKLKQTEAISSEMLFVAYARIFGYSTKLKAGRYIIEPESNYAKIFDMLTKGISVPYNVTILEGLTLDQIADELAANLTFTREQFLAACSDKILLDSLNVPANNVEGYLFPDTYNFFYDESPHSVVIKMLSNFYANLPDSFEQKAKARGLNFHEAITLASLIEREAMLNSERPIISAVYHSRLKKGMRLQCDPTVIYALGGINRRLYYKDLKINSPYNTYENYGLPPGPICSPGKASLKAAVNPAAVDYLYFVAKGDGSHIFSRSNDEHINAKNSIKRAQVLSRN